MRLPLIAIMAILPVSVMAAEIDPRYTDEPNRGEISWSVTASDTTGEGFINNYGCNWYRYLVENDSGLDITLQAGKTSGSLVDLNTAQMPDGVRYSSASTGNAALVCLCSGDYVDFTYTSAGSGNIYLTPSGEKCQ